MKLLTGKKMPQANIEYTKLRWLLTICGLVLYAADIWTDIGLAVKYFLVGHHVWGALTLVFVIAGLLATQVFSYAWYLDDVNDPLVNAEGKATISGMSRCGVAVLHMFCAGVFTRYYHLLINSFKDVWVADNSNTAERRRAVHHHLFCLATDLSMLKLFEAFLESVPQLLLQVYIILRHDDISAMQYLSITFSFFNIAWALVDYRRCLRRSLPHINEMPSGLPTVIYLLYKISTISSCILSYSLLLLLSPWSVALPASLWLLGTIWAHLLRTSFCSFRGLEFLYRAVVGVILTFTFFNVQGQDTKRTMIMYYCFHCLINILAPSLLAGLRPEVKTSNFFLALCILIFSGSVLGLVCLVVYYSLLHPRGNSHEADEVDGPVKEAPTIRRLRNFVHP